jgi:hypothetical protein
MNINENYKLMLIIVRNEVHFKIITNLIEI